ncbi:MAG: N-acetyltransferase family protein [Vicinamibacterales bacterium]
MSPIDLDRSYAPAILAILNDAIANSTALWDYALRPPESMEAWFDAKARGGYPVLGITDASGHLAGFASYGPFRAWPAYKYTVEHSVYVHRDHRGRGVGRALVEAVVARARAQGYHNVIAGIEASNAASRALHLALGFEYCGVVRHAGFKFGRWLDLELYQRLLDTPHQPADG